MNEPRPPTPSDTVRVDGPPPADNLDAVAIFRVARRVVDAIDAHAGRHSLSRSEAWRGVVMAGLVAVESVEDHGGRVAAIPAAAAQWLDDREARRQTDATR